MHEASDRHVVTVTFCHSASVVRKGCRRVEVNARVTSTVDDLVAGLDPSLALPVLRYEDPEAGPVTVRRAGDAFWASLATHPEIRARGPLDVAWLRATCADVEANDFLLGRFRGGYGHDDALPPEALREPAEPPSYMVDAIRAGLADLAVVDCEVMRRVREPYVQVAQGRPVLRWLGLTGPDLQHFEWSHADWYSLDELGDAVRFEGSEAVAGLDVVGTVSGQLARRIAAQHLHEVQKVMRATLGDADEAFFAAFVRVRALWRRIVETAPTPIDHATFEEVRRLAAEVAPELDRCVEGLPRGTFDKVRARLDAHAGQDGTDEGVLRFEAA